jgi:hypothetical protein
MLSPQGLGIIFLREANIRRGRIPFVHLAGVEGKLEGLGLELDEWENGNDELESTGNG